jgi:hypothetical protein
MAATLRITDLDKTPTGTGINVLTPVRNALLTDNDLSFNLNGSNNFSCTLASAATFIFTNIIAGQSGFIKLVNPSSYAISAHTSTKISASTLTRISSSGTYILSYFSDGTYVYVVASESLT